MATAKKRPSLKPRKVPQQSRAEKTVASVLEATARVLETKGLAGLNTNAVAQRAGVSIGSLYQYFPSKDALIVALSLRERAEFVAEAMDALDQPSGRQALEHLIAVAVNQQLRRPVLARLLDFEETRAPIARELAASKGALVDLIRQILARDDIPPQPDMEIATDDLGAILRALVDAAGERGEVDHEGLEQRVRRALFGYLGMENYQNVSNRSRRRST
jgi:AcrR family transcriptional regulator